MMIPMTVGRKVLKPDTAAGADCMLHRKAEILAPEPVLQAAG